MKIVEDNEMVKLVFPPKESRLNSYNVYIFQMNKKGIIIDSGNLENGREVWDFVKSRDIDIEGIVFSHYHLDHIGGYHHFGDIPIVIGSENYDQVLSLCKNLEQPERYKPTLEVSEKFGDIVIAGFRIKCTKSPGHSPCSIMTEINDKYLHVGDLVINSDDGTDLLPLGWYELIDDHIASLEWIGRQTTRILISGHGTIEKDENRRRLSIRGRVEYLKKIQQSKGKIDLKNALLDNPISFEHLFWHEQNLSD